MKEALRRLPKAVMEERIIRIRRALELDLKGNVSRLLFATHFANTFTQELPPSEWTKPEVDSVSYLEPYLSEVIQEEYERKSFRA
jgi:hypothetical protein